MQRCDVEICLPFSDLALRCDGARERHRKSTFSKREVAPWVWRLHVRPAKPQNAIASEKDRQGKTGKDEVSGDSVPLEANGGQLNRKENDYM